MIFYKININIKQKCIVAKIKYYLKCTIFYKIHIVQESKLLSTIFFIFYSSNFYNLIYLIFICIYNL